MDHGCHLILVAVAVAVAVANVGLGEQAAMLKLSVGEGKKSICMWGERMNWGRTRVSFKMGLGLCRLPLLNMWNGP